MSNAPAPITEDNTQNKSLLFGYIALLISPAFFSSNVVFGKLAADIAPFTLAFLRWSIAAIILILLSKRHWPQMIEVAKTKTKLLLLLGFLGMFICGGVVYLALHTTSATNGILIYTSPPVFILIIERIFRGRPIAIREIFGVCLAFVGVVIIVSKGLWQNLIGLSFTPGDLFFLLASISWAIYLYFLKDKELSKLDTMPLFGLIAAFGALTLLPMSLYEISSGQTFPNTLEHWYILAGIVSCASLVAFSTFQYGVAQIGASLASIFMYLLPPFGVGFAWFFLDEKFHLFHAMGIATILGGVILATFPKKLLRR